MNETKRQEWHPVDASACTQAMNTSTGVSVALYNSDTDQMVSGWFQAGEHWDAEAGEFVALGGLATRMSEALTELENLRSEVMDAIDMYKSQPGSSSAAREMQSMLEKALG